MTLTFRFIFSSETWFATAEVAIKSLRNAMRSSMLDVSNRAKLRRPPGSGAGREERRSLGCVARDAREALSLLGPEGDEASFRSPGVRAPFTAGRRGAMSDEKEWFGEWFVDVDEPGMAVGGGLWSEDGGRKGDEGSLSGGVVLIG